MTTRLKMQNRILPKIDFGVEPVPIDFARDAEAYIDIYILKKTEDILCDYFVEFSVKLELNS